MQSDAGAVVAPGGVEAVPESFLWGKSAVGGHMHLLLGHLLDAGAVAELVWDEFLAPAVVRAFDDACQGRGRDVFTLVTALHDIGKATPAFQGKHAGQRRRLETLGVNLHGATLRHAALWPHGMAGRKILSDRMAEWRAEETGDEPNDPQTCAEWWLPLLIAGHHGVLPGFQALGARPPGPAHAPGAWGAMQRRLIEVVATELGVDPRVLARASCPPRAVQSAVLGALVMSDWIASSDHFPGLENLADVNMTVARQRARTAWSALGLRGGWRATQLDAAEAQDVVRQRFGRPARPVQRATVEAARGLAGPGIIVVEAPTGEGKTQAALAAVEVLAHRFGADGLFWGMPTQATSDQVFAEVLQWSGLIDPSLTVGLLHGRRRFNPLWRRMSGLASLDSVAHGPSSADGLEDGERSLPPQWLLGSKRALLVPLTVGTIDHLLLAATRTRHVMLRHTGLLGRVVVLDEVHAYDVYMSRFLVTVLRWLGEGGVPVVLLSATLAPAQRRELVQAYLSGAGGAGRVTASPGSGPEPARGGSEPPGSPPDQRDAVETGTSSSYPRVLAACVVDGEESSSLWHGSSWRVPVVTRVEVLDQDASFSAAPVVAELQRSLVEGGHALVMCNTVARAQAVFLAAREAFGTDVVLLHGRFTAGDRARGSHRALDRLGRQARLDASPGSRLVVVATQVAEQSFDVDVDLLMTDLAPIDLLLQRAGRLHRFDLPASCRPAPVRVPRVVVTGVLRRPDAPPVWPAGSRAVYGDHLLLRAAALVERTAAGTGWELPTDVPALIAEGYDDEMELPPPWRALADKASAEWHERRRQRAERARVYLLDGGETDRHASLVGLHVWSASDVDDEQAARAVVRDGAESVEVVLVTRGRDGALRTLGGLVLGERGEHVDDEQVLEDVLAAEVRLPASVGPAALELGPLPAWAGSADPWLARARALVLDEHLRARVGERDLEYDSDLGLADRRAGRRSERSGR